MWRVRRCVEWGSGDLQLVLERVLEGFGLCRDVGLYDYQRMCEGGFSEERACFGDS